ncbi:MAG: hypothetical protein RJB39_462 [Candidatus Parcubacteria bacterium]|jgi:hypothetical protein
MTTTRTKVTKEVTKEWLKDSAVRAAAVAVVGALVIMLMAVGAFFSAKGMENTISVTGSARRAVVSDMAKLSITLRRSASFDTLATGYKHMNTDTGDVKGVILREGFAEGDVSITPPSADQIYDNSNPAPEDRKFDIREYIEVRSTDIAKIESLSRSITSVDLDGLIVEVRPVEYMYTKLSDIRGDLFAEAIKDAKVRAEAIASVSGRRVGKIKTAATGVVQILTPQSVEVSDYGTVDTSSVNKDVMVTARATFNVR